jgi:tetratricopeptide (TPR) repeat protein
LLATQCVYAQPVKPLPEEQQIAFDTHFINGNRYLMLKMPDEAVKEFKEALRINPNEAATNYLLAQIYLQKGVLTDAETFALKSTLIDKENTWYKKNLAEIYRQQKQYKKGAEVYASLYQKEPKNLNYLYDATYLYVMGNQLKSALKLLQQGEKVVGINEDIIKQKQSIFLAQGKPQKAITEMQKLTNAFPKNTRYMGLLADLYLNAGKEKEADDLYNQILALEPDNGYALLALADGLRNQKKFNEWFDYTLRAIKSQTLDTKTKLKVVVECITGKEFGPKQNEKSMELAQALAVSEFDESAVWVLLGDLYAQQNNLNKAHEQYQKALKIDPSNFQIWQQLVYSATELGDQQIVLNDCAAALEIFPNEPMFYTYYTFSAYQLKQYQKCIDMAKKGIEVSTEQQNYTIQLYATIGDAAYHLKQFATSDSAYEAALLVDPNNAYVLNNYAYFLSLRKTNLVKAAEMSQKSIELEPRNSSYYDTYGWVLFSNKKYSEAKEQLEKSLAITPKNAEVLDHYGDVLYFLGDVNTAVQQWLKAKEYGVENPLIDKKIKDKKCYE